MLLQLPTRQESSASSQIDMMERLIIIHPQKDDSQRDSRSSDREIFLSLEWDETLSTSSLAQHPSADKADGHGTSSATEPGDNEPRRQKRQKRTLAAPITASQSKAIESMQMTSSVVRMASGLAEAPAPMQSERDNRIDAFIQHVGAEMRACRNEAALNNFKKLVYSGLIDMQNAEPDRFSL